MEEQNQKYLHKWLNDELSDAEFEEFSQTDLYKEHIGIITSFTGARIPEFNEKEAYAELIETRTTKANEKGKLIQLNKRWLTIAASLVLFVTIGYLSLKWMNTDFSNYETAYGETEHLVLPDTSNVALNIQSSLSYNGKEWNNSRELLLTGEAYFKVAKGKIFRVNTSEGIVEVLGTQFNVKQREGLFEVVCYEGKVQVTHNKKQYILTAGDYFSFAKGNVIYETKKVLSNRPEWLDKKSHFNGIPMHIVLKDIALYYDVEIIISDNVDNNQLFSGGYTHTEELKNVLESICNPFNLTYTIKNKTVYIE